MDYANQTRRRPQIYEQDIDLILARRLISDRHFANAVTARIFGPATVPAFESVHVDRQVPHAGASGTIDLVVRLFDSDKKEVACILIENKLDSSFTPTQPERYASSVVAMCDARRPVISVICAPEQYVSRSKYIGPFATSLTYEVISRLLDGEDCSLVENAILRFSMPYEPDPVPEVQDFHDGYNAFVSEIAPELIVKRNPNTRGERPEASRTIYFDVKRTLPNWKFLPTLRFSHQCWDSSAPSASVKIMFDGWASHESLLRKLSQSKLGKTPLYLRRASRSLGLVHDTPRMDNKRPVKDQLDAVLAGIRAAAALRAWMHANQTELASWARAIGKIDLGNASE